MEPKQNEDHSQVENRIAESAGIIRRAQWGARPPAKALDPDWDYDSIVIHYTGHDNLTTPQAIQAFDLDHRHWDDMAYHYAISPSGSIYEGRELINKGSHVYHQNTGKVGIVCMGDFDESWRNLFSGHSYSGDEVRVSMLNAMRKLATLLRSVFPIRYFGGHMEYGDSETCPGNRLLPKVVEMRKALGFQAPTKKSL